MGGLTSTLVAGALAIVVSLYTLVFTFLGVSLGWAKPVRATMVSILQLLLAILSKSVSQTYFLGFLSIPFGTFVGWRRRRSSTSFRWSWIRLVYSLFELFFIRCLLLPQCVSMPFSWAFHSWAEDSTWPEHHAAALWSIATGVPNEADCGPSRHKPQPIPRWEAPGRILVLTVIFHVAGEPEREATANQWMASTSVVP